MTCLNFKLDMCLTKNILFNWTEAFDTYVNLTKISRNNRPFLFKRLFSYYNNKKYFDYLFCEIYITFLASRFDEI